MIRRLGNSVIETPAGSVDRYFEPWKTFATLVFAAPTHRNARITPSVPHYCLYSSTIGNGWMPIYTLNNSIASTTSKYATRHEHVILSDNPTCNLFAQSTGYPLLKPDAEGKRG